MNGWIELAEAIIEVAFRDIIKGHKVEDAKCFLNSEWYEQLQTTINLYRNKNNDITRIKEVKTLL